MGFEQWPARFSRRPMQFTILTKGLLLVSVPMVFQLILSGMIHKLSQKEQEADRLFVHTKLVEQQAQLVLTLLVDAQTGARGYVITENLDFAAPLDRATQELPKQFAALKDLVRDNPKQWAEVQSIETEAGELLDFHVENVGLVRAGDRATAIEQIASLEGKHQMDRLRRRFGDFAVAEQALDDERQQTLNQSRAAMQNAITTGVGASLLLAFGLAVAFTQNVSRRLKTLTVNSQNLALGQPLSPPIGGSDEIASLDQAFRDMAQALQQARGDGERFFALSLDLHCIANADGYFKRINPAFTRTLGWSEEELLARPFLEFVHPDDRAATLREVERQIATGQPVLYFENRYQHKDGSWRVLAWKGVSQPGGILFGVARDVTEAKRAEDALRLSEQDLSVTLDSIGDGVIATDDNRRITRMNPIAERMTGWSRSEAIGRLIDDVFQIVHEKTRCPAVIPVNRVLESGAIQGLANHTVLISRDGTEWPIADSAAPIRDKHGKIIGVVLTFRDVSEERRFERELQRLNAGLEQRVTERTAELQRMFRLNELFLTSAGEGIFGLDLEGRITFVNPSAAEMLGYLPQELLGVLAHANHHHTKADGSVYPRESCPIYAAFHDG